MTTLYNIDKELAILSEFGDVQLSDDEIAARLEDLKIEREEKFASICGLLKNIDSDVEAVRAEEKRLAEKHKALEGRYESIKKWIALSIPEGEKWSNGVHSISWRKSDSVQPDESTNASGEIVPMEYQNVSVTPDKAAMKKDMKAGIVVSGWKLVEKRSIQIK